MIGLVTPEARALVAELEKRRESLKQHPYITDGHATDSPGNVPATPRPASSWPGFETRKVTVGGVELTQVGDPTAPLPEPHVTLHDRSRGDHPERAMSVGVVTLQHMDLAISSPFRPQTAPTQPPFQTAPINTGGAQ